MNPAPNLFFVGPMGAGKTTIGRRVADLLGLPFHDLDHEIEVRSGVSVPTIFDVEGEAGFRRRESSLLAELAHGHGLVLATGGGAVLVEENRRVLREHGFVVYLQATVDEQLKRLARDRKRPLLAAPDRRERLQQLASQRGEFYRQVADLTVAAGHGGHVPVIAQKLCEDLGRHWQRVVSTAEHSDGRAA